MERNGRKGGEEGAHNVRFFNVYTRAHAHTRARMRACELAAVEYRRFGRRDKAKPRTDEILRRTRARARGTIKTQQITAAIRHRISSPCFQPPLPSAALLPLLRANDILTARSWIVTGTRGTRLIVRNELRAASAAERSSFLLLLLLLLSSDRYERKREKRAEGRDLRFRALFRLVKFFSTIFFSSSITERSSVLLVFFSCFLAGVFIDEARARYQFVTFAVFRSNNRVN